MNYIVFVKVLITFIVLVIWLFLFMLCLAKGVDWAGYAISILAAMFLAWLWSGK